jgi:hypothetical protein
MLDATGPQFRKYIARALASRAAEDEERKTAYTHALSREYQVIQGFILMLLIDFMSVQVWNPLERCLAPPHPLCPNEGAGLHPLMAQRRRKRFPVSTIFSIIKGAHLLW